MSNLRVNNITDEPGTGAPNFTNGIKTPRGLVMGTAGIDLSAYITQFRSSVSTVWGPSTTRAIIGTQTNHDFEFRTNDTEKMRIEAGGDIIIGNNLSTSAITLNASAYVEIPGPGLEILNGSLGIGSSGAGQIYMNNGSVYFFVPGEGIGFNGGSTGTGTSTSTLLNDYEEGTWTPVVADAATGGNLGSGTFAGHYIKVGRMVMLTVSLVNIVRGGMTAANDLFIRGLPYTAASKSGTVYFQGAVGIASPTVSNNPALSILDNTAYMRVSETPFDFMIVSEFTSGSADIYGTIMYEAAA